MPARTLLVALTLLGSAGGCAGSTGVAMSAVPGENFRLSVGQSAVVAGPALEIGFEGVAQDSRCPKGEACIWEGDAVVRIWVQGAAGAKVEREIRTSSKGPGAADYEGWSIRLVALDPYLISGRSIAQADYVVTLQVTRGSSTTDEIQ
jgi:hypothetical protein